MRAVFALAGGLALAAISPGCGSSAPRQTPAPPIAPVDDTWTETSLDDALAAALDGCHVRWEVSVSTATPASESATPASETATPASEPATRVRERWDGPGASFSLARTSERTMQARVRVTRGLAQLEAFATFPLSGELEPDAILAALAHPRQARLPRSSQLLRVFREERDGELITLEEQGGATVRERSLTRERNDGETLDVVAAGDGWSGESRAWVDAQGRHLEARTRGQARSTIEERDANGRVVAEHYTSAAYGETEEWTTRLSYDDAGRLTGVDDEAIEITDEGDTTRTCTETHCTERDAEGRLLSLSQRNAETPDSDPTMAMTIRRDEQGRVVEVQHVRDNTTRTTTIRRDASGHRVSVSAHNHVITGEWEGERLTQATTRTLHDGEAVEEQNLVRTYDEHARLTHSVVVRRSLADGTTLYRSEMRVTYAECSPSAEVVMEPEHLSPLESPFELLD